MSVDDIRDDRAAAPGPYPRNAPTLPSPREDKPSALNLGPVPSPRYGAADGEPVQIPTDKPSAMLLSPVDVPVPISPPAAPSPPAEQAQQPSQAEQAWQPQQAEQAGPAGPAAPVAPSKTHARLFALTALTFVVVAAASLIVLIAVARRAVTPPAAPNAIAPKVIAPTPHAIRKIVPLALTADTASPGVPPVVSPISGELPPPPRPAATTRAPSASRRPQSLDEVPDELPY